MIASASWGDANIVPDWLRRRRLGDDAAVALIAGGRSWTWRDLDREVGTLAAGLAKLGIARGDRVALLADNRPEFVVAVHAIMRLGAVLVPLNIRLAAAELQWQLQDAAAALLLHDAERAELATISAGSVPNHDLSAMVANAAGACAPAPESIDLDAIQAIVYTSGTSGRPKGALLPAAAWWWGACASALHLGQARDDRWLATLPLFHVGGLAILFRSAIAGTPVVLHERFDPERMRDAFSRERISLVSLVPAMLPPLFDAADGVRFPDSLRVALLGGSGAAPALVERALDLGLPVAPTYGLTEAASQVTTLRPDATRAHLGTSGQPLPATDVRIERDGGPLPPDEVGEIAIRGQTLFRGYLNLDDSTCGADGWFRTGDLGSLDAAGYLRVYDRRDDLIVSGGENVYPAEVEAVLLRCPAVHEAAVIGVADERWGAVPVAFVVWRDGSRPAEIDLIDLCRARLAPYKCPRAVIAMDALPRTASGKLLRRTLRDRVAIIAGADGLDA